LRQPPINSFQQISQLRWRDRHRALPAVAWSSQGPNKAAALHPLRKQAHALAIVPQHLDQGAAPAAEHEQGLTVTRKVPRSKADSARTLRFRKSHARRTNRRPKQTHTMAPITTAGIIKPDSAMPTAPKPPHAMMTKRKIIPQVFWLAFLCAWWNWTRSLSRSDGMAGFPWRIIARVGKP